MELNLKTIILELKEIQSQTAFLLDSLHAMLERAGDDSEYQLPGKTILNGADACAAQLAERFTAIIQQLEAQGRS